MTLAKFLDFMDYDFVITSGQRIKLIDKQGTNQTDTEYNIIDDVVSALYDDYANHIKDIVKNCYNGDWFKLITENKYIADIIYYMTHANEIKLFE